MALADGKVNFQLAVTQEERDMIKADAKALGMSPARYVVMVCSLVNESAREMAASTFVNSMTKAMLRGLEGSVKPSE